MVDRRRPSGANDYAREEDDSYRRGSTMSEASFLEDVDMAQDDIFSGPVSESVPTSNVGFAHRRSRADSTTSFTYYEEGEDGDSADSWLEEEAILDEELAHSNDVDQHEVDQNGFAPHEDDLEAQSGPRRRPSKRRKSSGLSRHSISSQRSRTSTEDPLLRRHDSTGSANSNFSMRGGRDRTSQKIYIQSEDLTIVIAGFKTSTLGYLLYVSICICTAGLAYLLFRWMPRLRIRLVGTTTLLRDCKWVVVENQWGEMTVQNIVEHEYGQSLSTVFGSQEKRVLMDYDEEDDPVIEKIKLLDYRYLRFCFHPLRDRFIIANSWKDPAWSDSEAARSGIDSDEVENRERVFGRNEINIEQKSILQLLMDEAFHPFYVFQVASLILWSLDEYYYYAICIFIISVASISATLIETRATMKRLRDISRFECDVRVLRNGFWRYIESSDLVPGDVYEITDPSLTQFPCDSLLLTGDCIVNESMLTGESVPVSKIPTTEEATEMLDLSASSVHPDVAKHMLFCGTKIVRARKPSDGKDDEAAALALVVRTGFNTTKGALVRSMLFPKPSGFAFYRDSFRYISVMGGIAGVGFIASFINFIRLGLAWHLIIVRALDLITIVVPPALPATLTIGTNFALSRLKNKQIFCISPQRVNVGGKIDVMCFDKTGTLTEEGLDVLGCRVIQRGANRFTDLLGDASTILPGSSFERDPTIEYAAHKAILYTMATCHSLKLVDGELVGDPLDVKMFDFTGWSYEEGKTQTNVGEDEEQNKLSPAVARPPAGMEFDINDDDEQQVKTAIELGVLKQFDFVSQLRRASVIVRQFGATGGEVFLKGAPEAMKDVCRPDSFPDDYEELLSYYTHRGFRVIACATKSIPKLNWVKVQKMKRAEVESDLEFIGFIIFENKLKPSTAGIIEELAEAGIRRVMCTGDNILTAISVARECGLIESSAHCFVPHFVEGDSREPLSKIKWESVDNTIFELDENTLKPLPPPVESDASLPYDVTNLRNYTIAISGDVFRWIIDFAPEEVLRAVCFNLHILTL